MALFELGGGVLIILLAIRENFGQFEMFEFGVHIQLLADCFGQ